MGSLWQGDPTFGGSLKKSLTFGVDKRIWYHKFGPKNCAKLEPCEPYPSPKITPATPLFFNCLKWTLPSSKYHGVYKGDQHISISVFWLINTDIEKQQIHIYGLWHSFIFWSDISRSCLYGSWEFFHDTMWVLPRRCKIMKVSKGPLLKQWCFFSLIVAGFGQAPIYNCHKNHVDKGSFRKRFRILSKWIVTRVIIPISGLYVPKS